MCGNDFHNARRRLQLWEGIKIVRVVPLSSRMAEAIPRAHHVHEVFATKNRAIVRLKRKPVGITERDMIDLGDSKSERFWLKATGKIQAHLESTCRGYRGNRRAQEACKRLVKRLFAHRSAYVSSADWRFEFVMESFLGALRKLCGLRFRCCGCFPGCNESCDCRLERRRFSRIPRSTPRAQSSLLELTGGQSHPLCAQAVCRAGIEAA